MYSRISDLIGGKDTSPRVQADATEIVLGRTYLNAQSGETYELPQDLEVLGFCGPGKILGIHPGNLRLRVYDPIERSLVETARTATNECGYFPREIPRGRLIIISPFWWENPDEYASSMYHDNDSGTLLTILNSADLSLIHSSKYSGTYFTGAASLPQIGRLILSSTHHGNYTHHHMMDIYSDKGRFNKIAGLEYQCDAHAIFDIDDPIYLAKGLIITRHYDGSLMQWTTEDESPPRELDLGQGKIGGLVGLPAARSIVWTEGGCSELRFHSFGPRRPASSALASRVATLNGLARAPIEQIIAAPDGRLSILCAGALHSIDAQGVVRSLALPDSRGS